MKKLVIFNGAGMSSESGLKTFRDNDGLWEKYRVEDETTPEAWQANPGLVLQFYNARRKQLLDAKPNPAHFLIKKLEEKFDVTVITQNIDDLHERAGSSNIVHLYGGVKKSKK